MTRTRSRIAAAALSGVVAALLAGAAVAESGDAAPVRRLAKPVEVTQPQLRGTFRAGETVSTTNGTWRNNPTSFTYQWLRCTANGASCVRIDGATSRSYRLSARDIDNRVEALVTASNRDGSTTANSPLSPLVATNRPPDNTAPPAIVGTAQVGIELRVNTGSWSGRPTRFEYQWLQCDASGNACAGIAGATTFAYGVRSADVSRTLRVNVRAVNDHGASGWVTSAATALVRAGGVTITGAVSVSSVSLPNQLIINAVKFSPTAIQSRDGAFIGRFRVTDVGGRPVAGALVLAQGIPANRVSFEGERATDGNGWATFTFRPLRGLPFKRGAVVVFFLRARKPGENLLAGVSTRRLVQIRVSPR